MRDICLILAPSNLGLRPLRLGHEPGTWRAPEALIKAGLTKAIAPARIVELTRPIYRAEPQPGTRLLNGLTLRRFNLALADTVATTHARKKFPLVVGGDCSITLGALAGLRPFGPLSLVYLDGHSDFRHPGNYDPEKMLGAVAGMGLAMATGRGETLMTDWPDAPAPLVPEEQIIQIGEREGRNADFPWPDVNDTAITRIDVFAARESGAEAVLGLTRTTLKRQDWPFWIHFDVDALDQAVMPAVDSPGSPGIDTDDVVTILRTLAIDPLCRGMTMTVFDPDLDPTGDHATLLVGLLRRVFDCR
jgi:arginase